MAVSMADITKLRKMTGAGMMDCKNALTEAEGDFDKAMEIIRKKGQAVAAKRSEREAAEGCVLAKTTGDRAVIIALKCETDFVAQNADFVAATNAILDIAVEADAVEEEETYEREQQDRRHQRAVPVGTHSREPFHPFQHGGPPPAFLLTDQVGQQDEAEQRRSDQCQRSEEPEVAQ